MNLLKDRLQDIEKNGYQLDFGNVFNHAFENYKKIALYAGLVLFVFTILFGVFAIGTLITFWGIDLITQKLNPENLKSENLTGSSLFIYSGVILLMACLLTPFQAGFLKMADCADTSTLKGDPAWIVEIKRRHPIILKIFTDIKSV